MTIVAQVSDVALGPLFLKGLGFLGETYLLKDVHPGKVNNFEYLLLSLLVNIV